MSESLSLLSGGGGDGGGGGDEGGGVIGVFISAEIWSTELSFPSVVDSSSTCILLMSTSAVNGPLQLFVCSFECFVSSKSVFGGGGTPSCVGKSKWILRRDGAACEVTQFPSSGRCMMRFHPVYVSSPS